MIPYNYLPAGLENDELLRLLCQNVVEKINNVTEQINSFTEQIYNSTGYSWTGYQNVIEQSNYSTMGSSWTSYQNVGEPRDYDSGMKGKMDEFDYELSKIVGLRDLKLQLQKWAKGMLLDEKRRAMGINLGPRKPPHMAFLGNPGTGCVA